MKKCTPWIGIAWYALSLAVFVISLRRGHFADLNRRWDEWDDDSDA